MVTEVNDCIDMEGWDCHMVSSDDRAMLYFQRTKVKSLADVNSARQVRPSAGNRFSPDAVFLHCLSYDVPCGSNILVCGWNLLHVGGMCSRA